MRKQRGEYLDPFGNPASTMTRFRVLLKLEAVNDGNIYPRGLPFSTNCGQIRRTGHKACADARSSPQRYGRRMIHPYLIFFRRGEFGHQRWLSRITLIPAAIFWFRCAYSVIRSRPSAILANSVSDGTRRRRTWAPLIRTRYPV